MKKIKHILACLLLSITLSGCSLFDGSSNHETPQTSTETTESSSESHNDHVHHGIWKGDDDHHWKTCDECGEIFDYSEHEFTTVEHGNLITYTCCCGYVYQDYLDELEINSFTIDSSNFKNFGTYNTGNYGNKAVGNWNIEYYRILSSYGYCFGLKPNFMDGDNTLPAAFYNTAGSGLIFSLKLHYSSSADFYVRYGNNAKRSLTETISKDEDTVMIMLGKSRFFSIESGTSEVYITYIDIGYINDEHRVLESAEYNNVEYRIRPTTYQGDLVDGVSSVSVPTSVKITDGKYTVLSSKTYTYYSYEYVSAHEEVKEAATMTSKEDVANYYLAFHRFPANYGMSKANDIYPTVSQVNSLFGNNARKAQTFERTDGYATAVPFNGEPPHYHELDVGMDGVYYSTSNRGVGRIVVWDYGFSCYNADDVVAVYTDDHYYTFQEYLNYGEFGDRFNAEGLRVSHAHKPAHTLVAGA